MNSFFRLLFNPLTILLGMVLIISWTIRNDGRDVYVDPKLEKYVDQWVETMENNGIEYEDGFNRLDSIVISDLKEFDVPNEFDVRGLSNTGNGNIYIDVETMEMGADAIRWVVFHELGHAVYKLSHSEKIMAEYSKEPALIPYTWPEDVEEYVELCRENEYNQY